MKHIYADNQPAAVKQFLLSLEIDSDGSIIECGGRQIRVFQAEPHGSSDVEAIQRGVDEMQAGLGVPLEDADRQMRQRLGFPPQS